MPQVDQIQRWNLIFAEVYHTACRINFDQQIGELNEKEKIVLAFFIAAGIRYLACK